MCRNRSDAISSDAITGRCLCFALNFLLVCCCLLLTKIQHPSPYVYLVILDVYS